MKSATGGALGEWRRFGLLPVAAALGYASCVIHIYGLGVFIEPVARDFGWSRTQVAAGLTLSTIIQIFAAIPVGLAIDRFGPRVLALVGVPLACLAFANISTANGDTGNWYLLWVVMSLSSLPIQATVWASAVASRFAASRGLALAVTLCGASVALIVFPWLGAKLIQGYGWRQAMRIEALIWGCIAFPVVYFLFRGAQDRQKGQPKTAKASSAVLTGLSLSEGLKTSTFWRLFVVAILLTFGTIGLNVHFPLVLKGFGYSSIDAAGLASLIGWFSIPGRLATGMMLDRFRASLVGAVAFLLPATAAVLLLYGGGTALSVGLAAAMIGFTLGAEVDVLVFLTTRYFGLRSFGALYGGILAALSVGTAFGPLAAARVFDLSGSYDGFLGATVAMMVISSLTLASLPKPQPELYEGAADAGI